MAEAASRAVSAANENAPELRVSAFHLGKCWFRLIESSGERMFTVSYAVIVFGSVLYFVKLIHVDTLLLIANKVW